MTRPDRLFDWRDVAAEPPDTSAVGTRRRLRLLLTGFGLAIGAIVARAAYLESQDGAAYRSEALRPIVRTREAPARRGRILARDGTVLAVDRDLQTIAVHYRYLQDPADAAWLRRVARSKLPRAERRKPDRVKAQELVVLGERKSMHRRLAAICGISDETWLARRRHIVERVEALAKRVNEGRDQRREERQAEADQHDTLSGASYWRNLVEDLFAPPQSSLPQPIIVAEQTAYHVLCAEPPQEALDAIAAKPSALPGVRVQAAQRRSYPQGSLAAHLVGHTERAPSKPENETGRQNSMAGINSIGRMGIERRREAELAGRSGVTWQRVDRRSRVLETRVQEPVQDGQDVVLSIDPRLQLAAEALLDRAREQADDKSLSESAGGAIVAMDVDSGELLAAAAAPRFDPNLFTALEDLGRADVLNDPGRPLFDRATRMAIPPGSVFKTLTAIALLESAGFDPQKPFHCQGYLREPDRQRCFIYRRFGLGHGDVTLSDALAQSCNVYFFHHAEALGPAPLIEWASRFGFGQPTGVDLPDEAAGNLPSPVSLRETAQRSWKAADTQAVAIGQGDLTVTPLQVARLMAAVANGGRLLTPRLVTHLGGAPIEFEKAEPIRGLHSRTLEVVREGLERVVADPDGTGYDTVRLSGLAIAGKTGTAETGGGRADHAWFAGYAPADRPRVAFVVALEHSGGGASAAGPLAKRLVQRMRELGYFAMSAD